MSNEVRVCNPSDFKFLVEFEGGKVSGLMGAFVEDIMKHVKRVANVTIKIESMDEGVGERVNGSEMYTGCIGRVQANQSDVILSLVNYPLPAVNVSQGNVVLDSVIQFLTAYFPRSKEEVQAAQIESSFASFSSTVWLLCLSTMFVTLFTFLLARCVTGRGGNMYRYPIYQVMVHMTNRGQLFNSTGVFAKTLFLTLSFFSFIVIFYFNALIKTDLVVVKPPETLRTYRDLLDKKVFVSFFHSQDTYLYFKFAPAGSDERLLWDLASSRWPVDKIIFKADINTAKTLMPSMARRERALVTESLSVPLAMREACAASHNQEKLDNLRQLFGIPAVKARSLFPLTSQDAHARVFMKGVLSTTIQAASHERLRKVVGRSFEVGLLGKALKVADEVDIFDLMGGSSSGGVDLSLVEQCRKNILLMPEAHEQRVEFKALIGLITHLSCLLMGATVIFLWELLVGASSRRKPSTRRKKVIRRTNA